MEEASKLQHHLTLLREEYVKLQNRYAELEQKYAILKATAGGDAADEDCFVARLLHTVADLFDSPQYSDLHVQLEGRSVCAHKFVLLARGSTWEVPSFDGVDELDWRHLRADVGLAVLLWAYTDRVDFSPGDGFTLDLMRAANVFKLDLLLAKCEKALMSHVTAKNCIQFYATAVEIAANNLKEHCFSHVSTNWDDFTAEDFTGVAAPLLYELFKGKTKYPLHAAIRFRREDVVFLFLVENNSQLSVKLNELDSRGDVPLLLALTSKQKSVADTLVQHQANVDIVNDKGWALLHSAIHDGDEFSALFLLEQGASVSARTAVKEETPLHFLARSSFVGEKMVNICKKLLEKGANPNLQDIDGFTPVHGSVLAKNEHMLNVLLEEKQVNYELKTADGYTALWFALKDGTGMSSRLVEAGASVSAVRPSTDDSLLHLAAYEGLEDAALFLAENGANPNYINVKGESPLHLACLSGLNRLVKTLLTRGADPNVQTLPPRISQLATDATCTDAVHGNTPLHLAIRHDRDDVVDTLLGSGSRIDLDLKNSEDVTPLGLSLRRGLQDVAVRLINAGANVGVSNSDGLNLLHEAVVQGNGDGALFLLQYGADINAKTADGQSPLELAVAGRLPSVVEGLCRKGVNMLSSSSDSCPLWMALESGDEDIASILVRHGADPDFWSEGPEGCFQTLLHRAIDDNNENVGCFLVRSGCDVNSPRRPGPDGRGGDEARDQATPLHLCCQWGLAEIAQTLLEHNAAVNLKDVEGQTPLHIAIQNQHDGLISLLLSHPNVDVSVRNKAGLTPFAVAMAYKNNRAAQTILNKYPSTSQQVDSKGRNFLHSAVERKDMESVLFLLSVRADVHARTQDSSHATPLHLAVKSGSEMIVRNLLLAGARVNDRTQDKRTPLHLAASSGWGTIASILLENGIDFDAVDSNMNNALHVAVREGHLSVVKVLLSESQIDAGAVNLKGHNSLHVLANYGKENAAAIFDLFMEAIPGFPIDKVDVDGNSALLLAYIKGNGNLCRALVKAGACVGTTNKQGITIFNYQVPTKQLLYRLLDFLAREPPWAEGDLCLECGAKFGITLRKHHCRHCGRLLCSKCSDRDMPIIKFNLNKPVRVCETCYDVLTIGSAPD